VAFLKRDKRICGILFDLDDTLCDYRTAARNARLIIYEYIKEHFSDLKVSLDTFLSLWRDVAHNIWHDVICGKLPENMFQYTRFKTFLKELNIENEKLAKELSSKYEEEIIRNLYLFNDARDALPYLSDKYILGILTNGARSFQIKKIEKLGIRKYFSYVFISEDIGFRKPDVLAFKFAISRMRLRPDNVLFIGDSPVYDITGAKKAKLKVVWINRSERTLNGVSFKPDYEIRNLKELLSIL